jgi:hypothetical protein
MRQSTPSRSRPVADGGTLRTLASGLEIVRRIKHEWSADLDGLTPEQLAERTGGASGAKFLDFWTSESLANRIEAAVTVVGWTADGRDPDPLDLEDEREIGVVSGRRVHTMRVVCDGRHVHAFPIDDGDDA